MNQLIRWDTPAKIVRGDYQGWYVTFVDDSQGETGGAYVLIVHALDGMGEG